MSVRAVADTRSSASSQAPDRTQPQAPRATSAAALPDDIRRIAKRIARTAHLVVACDCGTIVATRPDRQQPYQQPLTAMRALAKLDATTAVTVSRRDADVPAVVFQTLDGTVIAEPDAEAGSALAALRTRVGATGSVFIRYRTDAPAASTPGDTITIRTATALAEFIVADTAALAALLSFLRDERDTWLRRESHKRIEQLSMLADGTSVALLAPEARLIWMCHPRPDSAPVFAALLGGADAGHFTIRPSGTPHLIGQRYLPGTMTVETRWQGMTVTDYLDRHRTPNRTDLVRVINGSLPVSLIFTPRPRFGQARIRLVPGAEGLRVTGACAPIVLRSPGLNWTIMSDGKHEAAWAAVSVADAQPLVLELRCGTQDLSAHPMPEYARRERSCRYWSDWLSGLVLPTVEPGLVARSALTLRGLWHAGMGAFLAAATTSLPEEIGGTRNWDYRYCWLRDSAMSAQELVSLGSTAEATGFLRWIRNVLAASGGADRLQPLYTLGGEPLGLETAIEALPGYAGSRPIRIGNLASQQVQLDVFGPLVELVVSLSRTRGTLTDDDWELVYALAEAVTRRWREPDHGIWEERTRPRHYVYSKVMCWVTLDRAVSLARRYRRCAGRSWTAVRDAIAAEVIARGWHPQSTAGVGAFTAAYDGNDLDVAALHVGLSGLVSPHDPRFESTIIAIERELHSGPTVYRYRREDGIPGNEGGFHLCAAWLIEAYLLSGRRNAAEELFGQLAAATGPTGLLSEQYDPLSSTGLGNHPQAYSHLSLIRTAKLLADRTG